MRLLLSVLTLAASACATVPRPQLSARPAPEGLQQAAAAFYAASTHDQLAAALATARGLAPDSAVTHELGAQLAMLDGRADDQFDELLAALADSGDDAALLHLHQFTSLSWTTAQRPRAMGLLLELAEQHPDDEVRALAAWVVSFHLGQQGDLAGRARWLAQIPGQLPLAIVGTWDNDQGKGFEQELGPELRPGLDETYPGRSHPLRWRPSVPVDPRGRVDFVDLLQPVKWMVAFAQGTFQAPSEGFYAVRLTTTDPVKVWVDGRLEFAQPEQLESAFDDVVIPLRLAAGPHRLLVKSAQREGSWQLAARVTPLPMPGGGPSVRTFDQAVTRITDQKTLLFWRIRRVLPTSPERAMAHLVAWAQLTVGGTQFVTLADAWAKSSPKSTCALVGLVDALWFNQERGRTADLLAALDTSLGEQLRFVHLRQMRFTAQQGLKQKAREQLQAFVAKYPEVREGWSQLGDLYEAEGWTEDALRLDDEMARRFSLTAAERLDAARALLRDGQRARGLAALTALRRELPGHAEASRRLTELELDEGDFAGAIELLKWRLQVWPTDLGVHSSLAEVYRRTRDLKQAEQTLARAQALSPDAAQVVSARAALRYEQNDKAQAVALWKRSLELDPDNEKLANRLDWLSPEARGPWFDDVPDEATLQRTLASRRTLQPKPAADVAYLLDHEVTQLNSDGSSNNVVTMVQHALNAAGRDRLTRLTLPSEGRVRVLNAFAIDPTGQRTEASNERGRQIFFRNLQVGSTVVLQYRHDASAVGFLSRYLTKSWSFQGVSDQRTRAEFVLWAPLQAKLHERSVGGVKRDESRRGDQLRIVWHADDTAPLVYEPGMPTAQELAANIRISTVPDWDTWLSWEKALLDGAFRQSPELDAVVAQLGQGSPDLPEKARRIHQFVMQDIRYQQDYESFIAGVKPHPAPMVLERKYGDCKDKAVLFITLAQRLGLDAHFALVRTRDTGPLDAEVPMQQFNHAIVYVPGQPGFAEGRFFDPTADLLDLDAVRADDTGTSSLVFDPVSMKHTWREIPFQGPELNSEASSLKLKVAADGSATGTLEVTANGRSGSGLRRAARNSEVTAQLMQRTASAMVSGGNASDVQLTQVKDLRQPARLSATLTSRTAARLEGDSLRLRLPTNWAPQALFALAARRHPLVLGAPTEYLTHTELSLPDGWVASKLPAAGEVKTPCLTFARTVSTQGPTLVVDQRVRLLCERIGAGEYGMYREQTEAMTRVLDDEAVLGPARPAGKRAVKASQR